MNWSNSGSSSWIGINILAGNVNIGTATGNTIGNSVGTASIVVTNGANGNTLNGIRVAGTGNVDIQKNVVAGIKTAASSATNGFHLLAIEKQMWQEILAYQTIQLAAQLFQTVYLPNLLLQAISNMFTESEVRELVPPQFQTIQYQTLPILLQAQTIVPELLELKLVLVATVL